jgi:hypothetical protein
MQILAHIFCPVMTPGLGITSYTNQPHKQAILKKKREREREFSFTFPGHCIHESIVLGPQLSGESSPLKSFPPVFQASVTQ